MSKGTTISIKGHQTSLQLPRHFSQVSRPSQLNVGAPQQRLFAVSAAGAAGLAGGGVAEAPVS
jgi:hypothetical protein